MRPRQREEVVLCWWRHGLGRGVGEGGAGGVYCTWILGIAGHGAAKGMGSKDGPLGRPILPPPQLSLFPHLPSDCEALKGGRCSDPSRYLHREAAQ